MRTPELLTASHQQPGDTRLCRGGGSPLRRGRSLQPRVTPRATKGRRCLSTCSENHKARQQQATPPAEPGADLGLWAPGGRRGTSSCQQVRLEDTRGGAERERRTEKKVQRRRERVDRRTDRPTDTVGGRQSHSSPGRRRITPSPLPAARPTPARSQRLCLCGSTGVPTVWGPGAWRGMGHDGLT